MIRVTELYSYNIIYFMSRTYTYAYKIYVWIIYKFEIPSFIRYINVLFELNIITELHMICNIIFKTYILLYPYLVSVSFPPNKVT